MEKQANTPTTKRNMGKSVRRLLNWFDFLLIPNALVTGFTVGAIAQTLAPDGTSPVTNLFLSGSFSVWFLICWGGLRNYIFLETDRFFGPLLDGTVSDLTYWGRYTYQLLVYVFGNLAILCWNIFLWTSF